MIHWISETERLPEPILEHGERVYPWVLIYTPYGISTYTVGYYSPASGWFNYQDGDLFDVEFWAELQAPTKTRGQ